MTWKLRILTLELNHRQFFISFRWPFFSDSWVYFSLPLAVKEVLALSILRVLLTSDSDVAALHLPPYCEWCIPKKYRASWSIWKKSTIGNPSALNLPSSNIAGSNKLTEMGVLPSASGLSAVIAVPTDYCCTLVCSYCSSRWLQACECACGGSTTTVTCTILGCGEGCSVESSLMWADSMPPFCPLLFKRLSSTQTSKSNCGHDCTHPYLLCRTKREDRAKA